MKTFDNIVVGSGIAGLTAARILSQNGKKVLLLEKAKAAGVKILSAPYKTNDRTTAIVEFPGGYIAELHSLAAR